MKLGKLGFSADIVTNITVVLVSLSLVIKLSASLWLNHHLSQISKSREEEEYSYLGNDYPETFPLSEPRTRVRIGFENTKHYALDTERGDREWEELVPGENGVVFLGKEKRAFTVSLFHQLKCLDLIRREIMKPHGGDTSSDSGKTREEEGGIGKEEEAEVARHCLNYLKQMILCRGDVHLESFNYPSHIDPIDQSAQWECRDWEVVYRDGMRSQRGSI